MTATRLFDRAVIRLSPLDDGEDVADFLQGLVTNDVKGLLPVYAGLLTPQGKTLFDFIVWPAGHGELLLDCEADAAEDLAKRLSLYRLRRKIAIGVDPALGVYWHPTEPIRKTYLPGRAPGGSASPDQMSDDPRLARLGRRWLASISDEDESADAEWLAHRLALGVPEGRAEMLDILWLETNAVELNGVSFTKGCYVGQENTARMNWRSKVNRRLVVVPLSQSTEKRRKKGYEVLDLAVDHLRVEDIERNSAPEWMRPGLSPAE